MNNINDDNQFEMNGEVNNNNTVCGKDVLKVLGLVFGGMFGVLFSIIYIVSIIDNIVYSSGYTKYDGVIIKASGVESYTSTNTRSRKSSTGRRRQVTEYSTSYKQDIVVRFNDTEIEMEDAFVDQYGYSVNDEVPIYVNNNNPDDIKIHADVSDKTYLYKFFATVGGYWIIYFILLKKILKHKKDN